jgi:hypothetical protein
MVAWGDQGTSEPPVNQAFDTAPAGAGERKCDLEHPHRTVLASLLGRILSGGWILLGSVRCVGSDG